MLLLTESANDSARLAQVRIKEVVEFSLSRKEGRCCGGKTRRKQSGQKRE